MIVIAIACGAPLITRSAGPHLLRLVVVLEALRGYCENQPIRSVKEVKKKISPLGKSVHADRNLKLHGCYWPDGSHRTVVVLEVYCYKPEGTLSVIVFEALYG